MGGYIVNYYNLSIFILLKHQYHICFYIITNIHITYYIKHSHNILLNKAGTDTEHLDLPTLIQVESPAILQF